jgi:hypothetical protein
LDKLTTDLESVKADHKTDMLIMRSSLDEVRDLMKVEMGERKEEAEKDVASVKARIINVTTLASRTLVYFWRDI